MRVFALTVSLAMMCVLTVPVEAQVADRQLSFQAEQSGWTELTTHENVVLFFRNLTAVSPYVRMSDLGRSAAGRDLHLITMARPAVEEPWQAHASGKPIVMIGAHVHGDEPASKEGLLLFARDLAVGPLQDLLDHVIFVLVPQINPDGAEAGSWGTRNSLRGVNLNRDYLRLNNPETRHFIRDGLTRWRPHVLIDAHELIGPPRIYDFYTSFPFNIDGPKSTAHLTRNELVPAIVAALDEHGFTHFPYHRVPRGLVDDPSIGVSAGTYGARALSSYGGPHGAISLLYETRRSRDARVDLESRSRIQYIAMKGAARYVAENAEKVIQAVADGQAEIIRRGATWDTTDSISIRLEEVSSHTADYRLMHQGEIVELQVPVMDSAVATMARVRPVGYLIEPHRGDVAEHLMLHGLKVERLLAGSSVQAESFQVDSINRSSGQYEGYIPRTIWTTPQQGTLEFQNGAFLVRAAQPSAGILFHLMEPEDENSLAATGMFATEERRGRTLSVHRLMELPRAPSEVLVPGQAEPMAGILERHEAVALAHPLLLRQPQR